MDAGWSRDIDEIVFDALRRYTESHRESLMAHSSFARMSSGASGDVIDPAPEVVCDAGPLIRLDEVAVGNYLGLAMAA